MDWFGSFASLMGAALILAVTYVGARRLGLTDLQKAVRVETDALISRLRDRVALLEAENKSLHSSITGLEAEAGKMRHRIDDLEQALADVAVNRRPRRAT